MLKLALLLIYIFFPVIDPGYTCHITVENIGKRSGNLYIGWYNQADGFRQMERTVYRKKISIKGKDSITVGFKNIPKGTYAVSVFLDEDANGKLSTGFMGIPKELYGFSNNPTPFMRAATFEETAFKVTSDTEIVINLK